MLRKCSSTKGKNDFIFNIESTLKREENNLYKNGCLVQIKNLKANTRQWGPAPFVHKESHFATLICYIDWAFHIGKCPSKTSIIPRNTISK